MQSNIDVDALLAWLHEKAHQQAEATRGIPPSKQRDECNTASNMLFAAADVIGSSLSKLDEAQKEIVGLGMIVGADRHEIEELKSRLGEALSKIEMLRRLRDGYAAVADPDAKNYSAQGIIDRMDIAIGVWPESVVERT